MRDKNHWHGVPNLFTFATKELSQDAFLCWLMSWADKSHKSEDGDLNRAGKDFINELLKLHGRKPLKEMEVRVRTQLRHVDIVVEINDNLALLIEDKTHTGESHQQLARYLEALKEELPGKNILPIFIKTGDQCSYEEVESEGYKCFLRKDLLKFLDREPRVEHAILRDFHKYLKHWDDGVENFLTTPVSDWHATSQSWIGFFKHLKIKRPSLKWNYVPNARGGFECAYWHVHKWSGYDTYLQIEGGPLCFKISASEDEARDRERWKSVRSSWENHLNSMLATQSVIPLRKPARLGLGRNMTVKVLLAEHWIARSKNDFLDLDKTLKNIENAEDFLDICSGEGK